MKTDFNIIKAARIVKSLNDEYYNDAAGHAFIAFCRFFAESNGFDEIEFHELCFDKAKKPQIYKWQEKIPEQLVKMEVPRPACQCGNEYNCGECGKHKV